MGEEIACTWKVLESQPDKALGMQSESGLWRDGRELNCLFVVTMRDGRT